MEESIKNFSKQFEWEPKIENIDFLGSYNKFIVCGMGGSALAGDLLRIRNNEFPIVIWRDYYLPILYDSFEGKTLVVASSFSGNTEETISSFLDAKRRGLPVAVIASGGKLLEFAKEQRAPYIQILNTGIQPRMATGYMMKALLKIIREEEWLKEISSLSKLLNAADAEEKGTELAGFLKGKTPIVYASNKNLPIAYTWKIKFNETGKIPAFANRFPELNHNEMTGFSNNLRRLNLHNNFLFIFLADESDNPRILKRMSVTKTMYQNLGFHVSGFELRGSNVFYKIFQNLLIADWTAFYLSKYYETDPENVPMVEEFKNLIK